MSLELDILLESAQFSLPFLCLCWPHRCFCRFHEQRTYYSGQVRSGWVYWLHKAIHQGPRLLPLPALLSLAHASISDAHKIAAVLPDILLGFQVGQMGEGVWLRQQMKARQVCLSRPQEQ